MANYKQKSRPKPVPQEQGQSSATTPGQKPSTSLDFVRIMLEATLGTFCYLRYIFPDEAFEVMELRKEAMPTDSAEDMTIPSTLIAEDSQIPASQQVTRALVTKKVTGDGSSASKKFLTRLAGITAAVELGYLRSFIMYIILDPTRPNDVLETVTFNFSDSALGPSCILTRNANDSRGGTTTQSAKVMSVDQLYHAMKVVIRDFVKETQDLPDLPEKRSINFKVFYSDIAPSSYQVPGFEEAPEDEGLVYGTHHPSEAPAAMAAHSLSTNAQGLSIRLASIAGCARPHTDVESLQDAPPRTDAERQLVHEQHLEDAELRVVRWDAETSVIDQNGSTVALGIEDKDGNIQPLPASQVRSEAESDIGCVRMYAKGHGERETNLDLVRRSEPWGVDSLFIATQEAGQASQLGRDSQETVALLSDEDRRPRTQSAQVTGSLSQIQPASVLPNHSDSSVDDGLISSDEHTDPSSQEFVKSKDTFRGASVAPSIPRGKRARSVRAPSTGTAPIPRSALTKRPKTKIKSNAAMDSESAKSKPTKKKATTGSTKPAKAKKASGSDGTGGSGSSTADRPIKPKPKPRKSAAAKGKAVTPRAKTIKADNTSSDESVPDDNDGVVACGCGFDEPDSDTDYIECTDCDAWKHAVCMGVLRLDTVAETFDCAICRASKLQPTDDELVDSLGHFHNLCLIRILLHLARSAKELPDLPDLCKVLNCGTTDATALLNRLVGEGFLQAEKPDRNASTVYKYIDSQDTKKSFSSYFRPGGSKERAEIPILANDSQLPSSQIPNSQYAGSQSQQFSLPQTPLGQVGRPQSHARKGRTGDSQQQEDIEMDEETPRRLSTSAISQRHRNSDSRSGITTIPESDPIEDFNSAVERVQGLLEVDVDDIIEEPPITPSDGSRRFDRQGKRKADTQDPMSNRPTARIRSATGMGLINCPFVEVA